MCNSSFLIQSALLQYGLSVVRILAHRAFISILGDGFAAYLATITNPTAVFEATDGKIYISGKMHLVCLALRFFMTILLLAIQIISVPKFVEFMFSWWK